MNKISLPLNDTQFSEVRNYIAYMICTVIVVPPRRSLDLPEQGQIQLYPNVFCLAIAMPGTPHDPSLFK
jgi:hypothetical protein